MIHCSIQLELGLIRPQSSQTLHHLPFAEKTHKTIRWSGLSFIACNNRDIQFPLQGFQNVMYTFFHHSVDVDCHRVSSPWNEVRIGLRWHMSPCCWCCSWMRASLAYRCLPFVRWTLYPCENNQRICPEVGFIYCNVRACVSLYSLDKNVAAQSSSLGMVSCFRGATLDVEHKLTSYLIAVWSECRDRLHMLVHCYSRIHVVECS